MRSYLEEYKFTVITDHQSLKWLKSIDNPSGRLARWALFLQQFDYEVRYRKRVLNKIADALSRSPQPAEKDENEVLQETIFEIDKDQADPWYQRLKIGVQEKPKAYPEFKVINKNLYGHKHHTLNYNERQDAWKLCVP